jgi:microcystin-dependent protein
MSLPFIGEIKPWANNYAPRGWAFCNGAYLSIDDEQALFAVIGTYFGGNGQTNFALPNLSGRAPVGTGQGPGLSNYPWPGIFNGYSFVTLSTSQIPTHTHNLFGNLEMAKDSMPDATSLYSVGNAQVGSSSTIVQTYKTADSSTPVELMSDSAVSYAGSSQAHENRQPSLAINFCIAFDGIFPTRS